MMVTLFWNRFRGDMDAATRAEYEANAKRMNEIVEQMPGYVSIKRYTDDDGERLSVIVFESEEAQQAWRHHPEHAKVQARGRECYYEWYRLMACMPQRDYQWQRDVVSAAAE